MVGSLLDPACETGGGVLVSNYLVTNELLVGGWTNERSFIEGRTDNMGCFEVSIPFIRKYGTNADVSWTKFYSQVVHNDTMVGNRVHFESVRALTLV